ncbi:MAG: DUF4105 domain-containing protein [Betaproteobacteria bacterium]
MPIGPSARALGFFLSIAAAVTLGAAQPTAASETGSADKLLARAAAMGLADDAGWLRLGHYRRTLAGGWRSEADDPTFFNAPDGKTNPRAELAATLRAFFSELPETDTQQNPQCRFVARYRWLKSRLAFDPAQLPEQPCPRFETWRRELDPGAATLVFPAAYINSPASMYGHTLLRLDGRAQTDRTRMLDYAVNFAAVTGRDNGLAFAWKGLMGGYEGRFSLTPYYLKIAEYSDLESRDLWEYELDLSGEEIDRMLEHVWEIGPVRFDYYFLDENCSYQLLWLLDVARPSLDLVSRFPAWVIPADTLRAVRDQPGLVRRVLYRPSRTAQFRHHASLAAPADVALALSLADGVTPVGGDGLAARPAAARAQVLDLAFDYLDFQRASGNRNGDATAPRLRELLLARSRVDAPEPPPAPVPAVRPEEGHGSARLRLGAGTTDGRGFQELRFRGAYHDLLDPLSGYGRGAQIEFGDIVARHETGDARPFLHRVTIVDVTSIAPRELLNRGLSWRVNIGVDRTRQAGGARPLLTQVSGGAGLAAAVGQRVIVYGLAEGGGYYSAHLDQAATVGLGARAGVLIDWNDRWRAHLFAGGLRHLDGAAPVRAGAGVGVDVALSRSLGLRLEAERRREFGYSWSTVGIHLNGYF